MKKINLTGQEKAIEESLLETLSILSDTRLIKRIKQGEEDVKNGKVKSLDKIKKELGRTSRLKVTRSAMNEIINDLRDKELLQTVAEGRQAIRKGTMGISFKYGMKKKK